MTSSKENVMCEEERGFTEHLSRGVFVIDKNNVYWLNTKVKEIKVRVEGGCYSSLPLHIFLTAIFYSQIKSKLCCDSFA